MPEETIFRVSSARGRTEIADYLQTLADELDTDGQITFSADTQSTTVSVPEQPDFEVEVEQETPTDGGPTETSVELEIEWKEDEESLEIGEQ